MDTPVKQEKYEKLQMSQKFLVQQLSQPRPSELSESKKHTANLQGIFPDLICEVQQLFSTSSCKILTAWTPCNEHLAELK